MSKLVNNFDDSDDYLRELAYVQSEVHQYEQWLWMEEEKKYDQKQKEAKITISIRREQEQLKEE